jgi:RNA polymerase sigma-70 factor (ECF subfamily)
MPEIDLLLWNKIKSGDSSSYELLFQKYYHLLCLFSKRYTNNFDLSREIVQDLFVHLWENRIDLNISVSLRSYLLTAVKYNSLRRVQNNRKQGICLDPLPDIETVEFQDNLEYAELQERLSAAIDSLPHQCQKIFKMSRYEHLKYSEIANTLGISVKTVEAQISKALRMLHEVFKEYYAIILMLFL